MDKFVIISLEIPLVLVNTDSINGIGMSSPDELEAVLLVRSFSSSGPKASLGTPARSEVVGWPAAKGIGRAEGV
jgi:hypothetical protein